MPKWVSTLVPSASAAIARAWSAATTMKMWNCVSIRDTAEREHLRSDPPVQLYVREDLSLPWQRDDELGGEQDYILSRDKQIENCGSDA